MYLEKKTNKRGKDKSKITQIPKEIFFAAEQAIRLLEPQLTVPQN